LDRIERNDRTVGSKALGISNLIKEKLPTPSGFVITTEANDLFVKKNDLEGKIQNLLSDVDVNDFKKLKMASEGIRDLFDNSKFPEGLKNEILEAYEGLLISREAKSVGGPALDFIKAGREQTHVSVRSSPSASPDSSFAGQMNTFLNVSGAKSLLYSIKSCWSSAYSPRAIFYRKKRGFSSVFPIGVIVEKMVDSEKSGSVIMTDDKIVIEGVWGLGNSLSRGLTSPDRYVLDKDTGKILEKMIGRKHLLYRRDPLSGKTIKESVIKDKVGAQLLNEEEVSKLFELYERVIDLYHQPQAIEWSIERGKIYLLQVRPFVLQAKEQEHLEGDFASQGFGISPGIGDGVTKIISNWDDFESLTSESIIVSGILSPEFTPFMEKIKGIVSGHGGLASSLSFVAREFGIPCITGIDISSVSNDQRIRMDGSGGKIFLVKKEEMKLPSDLVDIGGVTATEIKVNLDFSKPYDFEGDLDGGFLKPEGLFKEEDPFTLAKTNPEELINTLRNIESIARRFYPKVVWYRSYSKASDERNPIIGWRGIRRSLKEPDVLKCEIEIIKRLYSQGLNNIGVVLPFVSNMNELRFAKGLIPLSIKLGIEISTPSSCLEIESFCREGINLVLINLSELTQLTLGVDQQNPKVSSLYSELSYGVKKLIENVVGVCKQHNVETSILLKRYDPYLIESFVRMGIHSLALDPEFIDPAKDLVSRIERKMLLDKVRNSEVTPSSFSSS
jgi:pyruvate,water dikinase